MDAAFRATFSDIRTVKSRKVVQFLFEVPLEKADHALECLGGIPRPDKEVWAGIARVAESSTGQPSPAGDASKVSSANSKRRFEDLPFSQQAAIRCQDMAFVIWLHAQDSEHAAEMVRMRCAVHSRSKLDTNPEAAAKWLALNTRFLTETGRMAEQR